VGTIATWTQQADSSTAVVNTLAYDNADQLTSAVQSGGGNRLTRITYPSGASTLFCYDGLSRRTKIIEKNSSNTVTSTKNYLWIGSEITEERDASDNVTKRFFPQGEQQSGTPYYYTRDHLGSVREVLNSSGSITARYSYDPYGRTTLVSGTNLATKQYAGYYIHATSDLALTRYRAYDLNTGRWLSRDPAGEDVGPNLYQYCFDDPTDETDPFGLDPQGHHLVPQDLYKNAPDWMKKIFDAAKNRITDPKYNLHNGKPYNGINEPTYRKAVSDALNDFLKKLGKNCINDLTPEEAQKFADTIRATTTGPIGEYNAGVAAEMTGATDAAAGGATAAEAAEAEEGGVTMWEVIKDILIFGPK
jgi:RHS repeat-associated protein